MNLPVLSYTFLRDYENCPRKAWHKYVAKDLPREPMTEAMQVGIDVHKAYELALTKGVYHVPVQAKFVEPLLAVRTGARLVEAALGITENGTPCRFWDGNAWLRGKIDVALVAEPHCYIVDWKTGKPWEDPAELEIFSLLLQSHYPRLEIVNGNYVWLKTGELGTLYDLSVVQDRWNHLQDTWQALRERSQSEWEATPNKLCGWCPVRTCEHWSER